MRFLLYLLLPSMLGGCVSSPQGIPPPRRLPPEVVAQAHIIGQAMVMAMTERECDSALLRTTHEVRIAPGMFSLLGRIVAAYQATGTWPRAEDLSLPEAVAELVLNPSGADLEVEVRGASSFSARIMADSTVVVMSPFGTEVERARGMFRSSLGQRR